jgi:hypothetical protein
VDPECLQRMSHDITSSYSAEYYGSQFGDTEHFLVLCCFVKFLIFYIEIHKN